jgi:Ca2+-binding EF-hand superfamily protein
MRERIQDIDTCHKVFHLFARRVDGLAEINHLPLMLRQVGNDITDAAARDMVVAYPKEAFSFDEFVELCERVQEHRITRERLLEAFKTFDPEGRGVLSTKMIKAILQKSGEPMSAEEIEICIAKMNPDPDGIIDYEAFVKGRVAAALQ